MPNIFLITIFSLLFAGLTWHRFRIGLFLLFLLLPTYLIRFSIGGIPTTLLEVMVLVVLGVWLVKSWSTKHGTLNTIKNIVARNRSLFIAIFLFLLGATISVFTATDTRAAAGEWKAFYVEPVLLFFVIAFTCGISSFNQKKDLKLKTKDFFDVNKIITLHSLIFAFVLLGLATGILATIQHFTGWMVPWDFWENRNTFRVTGWYGFPNGVGLFLPVTGLLSLYIFVQSILSLRARRNGSGDGRGNLNAMKTKDEIATSPSAPRNDVPLIILSLLAFIFSILGIIFAKSTGGLIGVVAGIGLLFVLYKKTRWPAIALGLIAIAGVFMMPSDNAIRQELLAQNRSGQLRVEMWAETSQYLLENPLTGAGLASYVDVITPYRIQTNIEVFHHPHNLLLTMWVNIGLIGLIGFIWIVVWFYRVGIMWSMKHGTWSNQTLLVFFLMATMAGILVMGLVDSPYIKNDYAILFWFLIAGMLVTTENKEKLENT